MKVNIEEAKTLQREGFLVHYRPEPGLPEEQQYALVYSVTEEK